MWRPAHRARTVGMLALASILLAGCGVEDIPGIDEFFKQMFYLSPELVERMKGVLSYFLVLELPAFVLAAKAILGGDKPDWGEALHWMGVMLGIAFFTRIIILFSFLGKAYFFPDELNYTVLVESISLPEEGWWRNIIVWLIWLIPVFNAFWEFILLAGYGICILVTVFVRNSRPLSLFAVALLGWLFYPPVLLGLSIVTKVIGTYPPFEQLKTGIGPMFVVTAAGVGVVMFILPGLLATIFAVVFPSKFPSVSWKEDREDREDRLTVSVTSRIFELLGALGVVGPMDLPPRPPRDTTIYGNPPARPRLPGGEKLQGTQHKPKGNNPKPNGGGTPSATGGNEGENLTGKAQGGTKPVKGEGPPEVAPGESFTDRPTSKSKVNTGEKADQEKDLQSDEALIDKGGLKDNSNGQGVLVTDASGNGKTDTVDQKEALSQPNGTESHVQVNPERTEDSSASPEDQESLSGQEADVSAKHVTLQNQTQPAESDSGESFVQPGGINHGGGHSSQRDNEHTETSTEVQESLSGQQPASGHDLRIGQSQTESEPDINGSDERLTQPPNGRVVEKVAKVATYAGVASGHPEVVVAAELVDGADKVLRETGLNETDPVRQVPGKMGLALLRAREAFRGTQTALKGRAVKKKPSYRKEDEAFR